MFNSPIQKILFGSPGTGKSYKVTGESTEENKSIKDLLGISDQKNIIKTVFHPEYTYGDFIGKLLPQTTGSNQVIYKYYPGYFLKALGRAYKNIIDGNNDNVLLVIDELNRGNAAAIFGIVFQLLDRNNDGWSEYEVNLSMLEIAGLLESMGYIVNLDKDTIMLKEKSATYPSSWHDFCKTLENRYSQNESDDIRRVINSINNRCISIPSNLSIVATINTSDESIYYLDSAFKRRWDWEYIEAPHKNMFTNHIPELIKYASIHLYYDDVEEDSQIKLDWAAFVVCLNEFIKLNAQFIKKVDDKQIGWWFVSPNNEGIITIERLKNKLMFYLWDSVFSRDKRPLKNYLRNEISSLVTYADFINCAEDFMVKLYKDFKGDEIEDKILKGEPLNGIIYDIDDIPF